MHQRLISRFGKEQNPNSVLADYPRPSLVRSEWTNLNGLWDVSFRKEQVLPDRYEEKILVPFCPESALSGLEREISPNEYIHYRRTFDLSKKADQRVLLHFGAVDQEAEVYINGQKAGSHIGGYLPFSLNITSLVREGENTLQLTVRDQTDSSYHARGKQKQKHGGMWYTPVSGIWQSVWLECVPKTYVQRLVLDPNPDQGGLSIQVCLNRPLDEPVRVRLLLEGEEAASAQIPANEKSFIPLKDLRLWSPEDPVLYDLEIEAGEDLVKSYTAFRKIESRRDEKGILRVFLNGKKILLNGLLDQGYLPESLYTWPSDEAMIEDISMARRLGYNLLRKHVKIEPERWYYHCDRLGMMVMQDMVCSGDEYTYWFVALMPNILPFMGRILPDRNLPWIGRKDPEGKKEFKRELAQTIRLLSFHPSIIAWVPFNEGWGQFQAADFARKVKELDPGRLVDHASGWFDQGAGDFYSIHNYFRVLRCHPKRKRILALTECGGYSLRLPGRCYGEEVYGYKTYESRTELMAGIRHLYEEELLPGLPRGLSVIIYTQLSDIEDEVNGLITYDREELKVDEAELKALNDRLYAAFEGAGRKRP